MLDSKGPGLPAEPISGDSNTKKEGMTMKIDWIDFSYAFVIFLVIELFTLHEMRFF
jgi:hypothetical protein